MSEKRLLLLLGSVVLSMAAARRWHRIRVRYLSQLTTPTASTTFTFLNVATFLAWQLRGRSFKVERWLLENAICSPRHLDQGSYHTLLTHSFSHFDVGHFLQNMVSWLSSAPRLEREVGPVVFAVHCVGAAVSSGLAQSLWTRSSEGMTKDSFFLGASGVISATNVALGFLQPDSRVVLFQTLEMSYLQAMGVIALIDILPLIQGGSGGGRGVVAHAVGALWGFAFIKFGFHRQVHDLWRKITASCADRGPTAGPGGRRLGGTV